MVYKVYFRRFVALLLCCVLVWSSFIESAYATDPVTAASLAITGGQLAGAGLSGEAALSLAGPVGAVVGVTLGALGVNAYVSKAAQESGKTRTRFVLDKLVLWGAQAGYTQQQLYSKIAQGISVAADGTIQLGKNAAKMIEQFGSWLFTQDGEVVPEVSNGTAGNTVTLNGFSFPVGNCTTGLFTYNGRYGNTFSQNYSINCSTNVGTICIVDNNYQIVVFSYGFGVASDGITVTDINGTTTAVSGYDANINGYVGKRIFTYTGTLPPDIPVYYGSLGSFFNSLPANPTWNPSESAPAVDEVFTGTPESWAENKDVLNPSADDTLITLNPDLLNPIIDSLADGQQATMSIIDYLQALQDTWDHALDDVQTAIGTITDQLTGIQEQIAVPQEAVKNPTVTNPSVTPDTTPILDPSTVDPGTAVTGLSFDLTQIFPFCIPFDIYDMLSTLSATPEAPVYHVHYEGPYNILIDFTVDLSAWDSVASVLRTVELLAFCIGLAYVTRSMFIRS